MMMMMKRLMSNSQRIRRSWFSSSSSITTTPWSSESKEKVIKAKNKSVAPLRQNEIHVESYFATSSSSSAKTKKTRSNTDKNAAMMTTTIPAVVDVDRLEMTRLVDDLFWQTQEQMMKLCPNQNQHYHIVAFSGGVDSSLAAALVYQCAQQLQQQQQQQQSSSNSNSGNNVNTTNIIACAVLGTSPAVPAEQVLQAEAIAQFIGIDFITVPTTEGQDEVYIQNAGQACLACKTHLYSTLQAIAQHATETAAIGTSTTTTTTTTAVPRTSSSTGHDSISLGGHDDDNTQSRMTTSAIRKRSHVVQLYNGTNADDLLDATRLGLIAARHFHVHAPLQGLTKNMVRNVARHYFGLPNWNHAAQPCLRSRLALGVPATMHDLQRIERAERFVKTTILLLQQRQQHGDQQQKEESPPRPQFDETCNLRVRLFAGNRACIEVDEIHLPRVQSINWNDTFLVQDLNFASISIRPFKSGSVAATTTTTNTKTTPTTLATREAAAAENTKNNSNNDNNDEDELEVSTVAAASV